MGGVVSGAGAGDELTFVFGTPNEFKGQFISIAAGVTVVPPLVSAGGSLLFSPTTLPGGSVELRFVGFSLNVTAGFSHLPISFAVVWSDTVIFPQIIHKK